MNKDQALKELSEIKERIKILEQIINAPEENKPTPENYLRNIIYKCTGKVTYGRYITWYDENGQWIFKQDLKSKILYCYYYKTCEVFEQEYSMKYEQIQSLQMGVVGEDLNCIGFTPQWYTVL